MLTLPIKKKWFDMIQSGIKKEEYREIKPYYDSRFKKFLNQNSTEIIFRNGYSKKSPTFKALCKVTKGYGKNEWGAETNKEYYVLKIIKIN